MKKSLLPILALTLSGLALASCGKNDKVSSPVTSPSISTPVTPTSPVVPPSSDVDQGLTIGGVIADRFTGTMGKFTDPNYDFAIKADAVTAVTLSGTYLSSGDGSYSSKRAGYLFDEKTGAVIYLHIVKTELEAKALTEVLPGAKITVTGTLAAYQGYPQIAAGWTYTLDAAAPADTSKLYEAYKELTINDLYGTDGKANFENVYKPIKLDNLVLTGTFSPTDLTYFASLSDIGDLTGKKTIGIYRAAGEEANYVTGSVYTIYGFLTSYKGNPQLYVNAYKSGNMQTFNPVIKKPTTDLTPAQLLATQFLVTNMNNIKETQTFDYLEGVPSDIKITLKKTNVGGSARAFYAISEDTNSMAELNYDPIISNYEFKLKSFTPEAAQTMKKGTVKLLHRVCIGAAAATDAACKDNTDVSLMKEEIKEITVEHYFGIGGSFENEFNGSIPFGINYITNNPTFPAPSFNKGADNAIKLAYAKGGIETTRAIIPAAKVQIDLNVKLEAFKDVAEGKIRSSVLEVSLLNAKREVIKSFDTDNLFDADQATVLRNISIVGESEAEDIVFVKLIVKTSDAVTLNVKGIKVTGQPAAPVPPGPNPSNPSVPVPPVPNPSIPVSKPIV